MTGAAPRSAGVVGGGIVGLAVARELTLRYPGISVTVFEKEDRVAAHQSGHNSGVVHAGIYYTPGSLKARLCLRGAALLRQYCQERGVRLAKLGKLVVASSEAEMVGLAEIERRAIANRVPAVRRISQAEIADIEPHVRGFGALHSPHTASVDYLGMCDALVADIEHAGGSVKLNTAVTNIVDNGRSVQVESTSDRWSFDRLIVCAGLNSDDLPTRLGLAQELKIVPFRGEYYELRPEAQGLIRGMVYPVPDPRYPFLGVHLTRDVNDRVHVGPNAVLALALEGYRWRDVNVAELRAVLTWPGTSRLIGQHWRSGLSEMLGSLSTRRYLANVTRYVPEVELKHLVRSTAGVRAQAVRRDGSLVDDFALQNQGRITFVRNAPSPAATSSLAIAEHVVAACS